MPQKPRCMHIPDIPTCKGLPNTHESPIFFLCTCCCSTSVKARIWLQWTSSVSLHCNNNTQDPGRSTSFIPDTSESEVPLTDLVEEEITAISRPGKNRTSSPQPLFSSTAIALGARVGPKLTAKIGMMSTSTLDSYSLCNPVLKATPYLYHPLECFPLNRS